MDFTTILGIIILLWVLVLYSTWRQPDRRARGWVPIAAIGLLISVLVYIFRPPYSQLLVYGYGLIFGMLPYLGFWLASAVTMRGLFPQTRQIYRAVRVLHPFGAWDDIHKKLDFQEVLVRGRESEVIEALNRFDDEDILLGEQARMLKWRLTNDWAGLQTWVEANFKVNEQIKDMSILSSYIRSFAETNEIPHFLKLFAENQKPLARNKVVWPHMASLFLAHTGHKERLKGLFEIYPDAIYPEMQSYWLATADAVTGHTEVATARFEALSASPDLTLAVLARHRLATGVTNLEALTENELAQIEQIIENMEETPLPLIDDGESQISEKER